MALTMPELPILQDQSSSPTTVSPSSEGHGLPEQTINKQLVSLQTDVEDNLDVNKGKELYPLAPEPHRSSSFGYLSPTFLQENQTSDHCYSSDETSCKQTESSYLSSSADSLGYFALSSQSPIKARFDPLPTVPDVDPYNYPDEDSSKTDDKCSRSRICILVVAITIVLVVAIPLSVSLPIVLKDSTTEALVGGLTLDLEVITLAQVDEDASFKCSVKNVGSLSRVVFLFNQTEVATFDVRNETSTSSTHRFSLEGRKTRDGYDLLLTLTNVTCGDAGRYTCLASNGGDVIERWTRLSVMKSAVRPELDIPRLVDGLSQDPITCRISSMGHNSSILSISWFLRPLNLSIPPEHHQDTVCFDGAVCNAQGNSWLKIPIGVKWDKHDLCCQVQDPFQSEAITMETCQKLTVLPLVEVTQGLLATISEAVNITCTIREMNVTEVTFLSGGQVLVTFDPTNSSIISNRTNVTMYVNRTDVTEWQAILSITKVTCSHFGTYTCRVARGNGDTKSASTTLRVQRLPQQPRLTIFPAAVTHTIQNPLCMADNLGYDRAMNFRWTLRQQDGAERTFEASRQTDQIKEDKQTCITSGNSSLDGRRYREDFWNNSRLCCQLVDPETGQVVSQACGQVYTLPADFCSTGTNPDRYYPFEPCNTWVSCNLGNGVVYFNYCNNGMCFDPVTSSCSLKSSAATTRITPITTP